MQFVSFQREHAVCLFAEGARSLSLSMQFACLSREHAVCLFAEGACSWLVCRGSMQCVCLPRESIQFVCLPREHAVCPFAEGACSLSVCQGSIHFGRLRREHAVCPFAKGEFILSVCRGSIHFVRLPREHAVCPLAAGDGAGQSGLIDKVWLESSDDSSTETCNGEGEGEEKSTEDSQGSSPSGRKLDSSLQSYNLLITTKVQFKVSIYRDASHYFSHSDWSRGDRSERQRGPMGKLHRHANAS